MARGLGWLGWFLVMVGALNWGLIALAELDLIAALTGRSFGETNVLSRTIYALIGLSGVSLGPVRLPLARARLALAQTMNPKAIEVLLELLDDDEVAGHAVMALGKFGVPETRPAVERFHRASEGVSAQGSKESAGTLGPYA